MNGRATLRYAVLGLLIERRGYGYQLVQRLSARLGPAWRLSPASVYAAIDSLEADGLARAELPATPGAEALQRRSRRVVYEATAAGREPFEAWLRRPSSRVEPLRSELEAKIAFATVADAASLIEAVDHEERLVRELESECGGEPGDAGDAANTWEQAMRELARGRSLARCRAEREWLTAVRETLEVAAAGSSARHR